MGGTALEQRVERAAEAALAQQRYVNAIEMFLGLGWLAPTHLETGCEHFGPTNVNVWRVAIGAELGQGPAAAERGRVTARGRPSAAE